MSKSINAMSLSEIRTELEGYYPDLNAIDPTLDAIARCMPEGWCHSFTTSPPSYKVDREGLFPECVAEAWKPNAFAQTGISVTADTELLARARLALACHRASKSHGGGGGA